MPEVTIPQPDITFPPTCPVCLQSATHTVTLEKTMMLWVASQYVRQQVHYCGTHAADYQRAMVPVQVMQVVGIIGIVVGCAALFMSIAISTGVRGFFQLMSVVMLSGIPGVWLIGHYTRLLAASRDVFIHPKYRATYNALRIVSFRITGDELQWMTLRAENLGYAVKLAAANDVQLGL